MVAFKAVPASFRPLSEKAVHDGKLFSLEMTAETLPRDESLVDPDNFMPKSSILIVSSPYFSMTECGRIRRTLQLGT